MIETARTDAERVLLPIFVKHHRFAGHGEYRFAIWADEEPSECVVDLDISCAMFGSLKERPSESARLFDAGRVAERDSESAEPSDLGEDAGRDSASRELLDSTSDWFWPGLLESGDNPATPLSRTIDPTEFAENPRAATTAVALSALRSKVAQVRGKRRWKAASAAWHAEPWISHLCKRFVDPIGGVFDHRRRHSGRLAEVPRGCGCQREDGLRADRGACVCRQGAQGAVDLA